MPNPTFDHRHYVPILKCKRGELQALKDLDASKRDLLTPLLEIPFIDSNKSKSAEDQIDATVGNVVSRLDAGSPAFIDCVLMESSRRYNSIHPLQQVVTALRGGGLDAIPVFSLASDSAYQQAVNHCVTTFGANAVLRLTDADLGDHQLTSQRLDQLLRPLGLDASDVHLVVDFSSVGETEAQRTTIAAKALLGSLPYLNDWHTLTFASSSYPTELGNVGKDKAVAVNRTDWDIWNDLISGTTLTRKPAFGDYGSDSPGLLAFDPRVMSIGVNLRYSTADDYVVAKGGSLKKETGEKYRRLAKWLVGGSHYRNSSSWADEFLRETAAGNAGPGNAETWRRVGTNSHLDIVTTQIASLP